jgi:hypothetical protein
MELLAKLKDPRTNWKYILIVVVLALVVGGAIIEFSHRAIKETTSFIQFARIQKFEKEKETELEPRPEEGYEYEPGTSKKYEEVTYRNERFGFEFRYPKTYAESDWARAREENDYIRVGARIDIDVDDAGELSLSEYVDKQIKIKMSEEGFVLQYKENMIVGGEPAIKVAYYFGGMGRYGEAILSIHNRKIYIFNTTAGVGSYVSETEGPPEWSVFSRIIETFKFIR